MDDAGNRFGDLEITDPKAMRALAHPVRLAVLERLQRHGPATATQLSPHVGATPSVTSWHLRHLAGFGLVRDAEAAAGSDRRERRWEAVARGYRFSVPEDAEGRAAAQVLAGEMFASRAELPMRWLTETAPALEQEWLGAAMSNNTGLVVTAEELAALKDAMEELLAPYVNRPPAEQPPDSRAVRMLLYALPEAAAEVEADVPGTPE
jgi:DNA-binding transcriptional ArsR family regulator